MTIIQDRYQLRNIHPGTHGGIRTHTRQGLNPLPLPVGLHAHMVGRVRFELTMYLTSRFYRPLASANLHTCPYYYIDTNMFENLSLYYQTYVQTLYQRVISVTSSLSLQNGQVISTHSPIPSPVKRYI